MDHFNCLAVLVVRCIVDQLIAKLADKYPSIPNSLLTALRWSWAAVVSADLTKVVRSRLAGQSLPTLDVLVEVVV